MNVLALQALINCVVILGLGYYVYNGNPKSPLNRLFAVLCLLLGAWAGSAFMQARASTVVEAREWMKITALLWAWPAPIIFHFALIFTNHGGGLKRRFLYALLYLPALLVAVVGHSTNLIAAGPVKKFGAYTFSIPENGWFYWLTGIWALTLVALAAAICFRFSNKTVDPERKQQSRYVAFGLTFPVFIITLTAFAAPALGFDVPNLTVASFSILVFFVGYSVYRHGLFLVNPAMAAENIVATMTDSLILIGPHGNIVTANKATEDMLNYAHAALKTLNMRDILADPILWDKLRSKTLEAGLSTQNYESVYLTRNRQRVTVLFSASAITDRYGHVTGAVVIAKDISERKQAEMTIKHMAYYDILTDLPNRTLFKDRLDQALAGAKRRGRMLALLYLDIDDFKRVNDELGHTIGDLALKIISTRIAGCLRETDTAARVGGDEFNILLPDIARPEDVSIVAKDILAEIFRPMTLDARQARLAASIGISLYPNDVDNAEDLITSADLAMRRAKQKHVPKYQFYSQKMGEAALESVALAAELSRALERREFVLYYQPCVDITDGHIIGAEALLRWRHPERGLMLPAEFLPAVKETGLIIEIGEWVMESACRQSKIWQTSGFSGKLMVNLSSRQLEPGYLVNMVAQTLARSGHEPDRLVLELTEKSIMQHIEDSAVILKQLREEGINIAIDDFGIGYSSLLSLRRLPVDIIKISHVFMKDAAVDDDAAAIVSGIVSIAHAMSLKVVAEGVETQKQLDFLRTIKSNIIQGFLLSPPVPPAEFGALLEKGALWRPAA